MLAILEAKRAGLFKKNFLLQNTLSGVIVGVVALPLAMAFAIASGTKPEQGLYTAIIAGLIISICGGSRVQIAGPTGAFIVILSAITAKYGIEGLQIATLMAGIILLLMGFARLGTVIKYIPSPVIVGFTAGIGVIIWVSQWQDFFGLPPIKSDIYFHEKIWHLLKALPSLHPATTGLALFSLFVMLVSPKILKKVPGPLVAMIAATILQVVFKFDGVATIGSLFGGIPQGLPPFHIPHFSFEKIIELTGPAFTIAMLGSIESLLSAVVADGMSNTKHDSNQELIGQGLANIAAPFFGGFAATGAIARTATNIRNGGNSPIAGVVHSITLILVMLLLAPLAAYIPVCALAAILFVVAYNMSEIHRFVHTIKYAPRSDVIILLLTFSLTLFVNLVIAVNIGVILATLLFMQRMAKSVRIEQLQEEKITNEIGLPCTFPKELMVYSINGPLFFGAAETFEHAMNTIHSDIKTLIIRLRDVPFIDATGLEAFHEMVTQFQHRGVRILICEANERVTKKLDRAKIIDLIGTQHIFKNLSQALEKNHAISN